MTGAGLPWPLSGLREIVSYPPGLSTMRNEAGRLRNVVPGHGPARRLTFSSRAGKDAVRSRLPSDIWSPIAPQMPKAPARGAAAQPHTAVSDFSCSAGTART